VTGLVAVAETCGGVTCNPGEICCNSACTLTDCSVTLDPPPAGSEILCPGESLVLDGVAICSPDCTQMSLSARVVEPDLRQWVTLTVSPKTVDCGPFKTPVTVKVTVSPDAPAGSPTIELEGAILGTQSCGELCIHSATTPVTILKIRPVSVTFGGADVKFVTQDNGTAYPTTHWEDNSNPPDDDNDDVGDHNIPVVYPRGTTMVLSATFSVEPATALSDPITVTGTGTSAAGMYTFSQTVIPSGGTITLTNVPANVPLVNTVHYLNPLSIAWSFTPQGKPPLSCTATTKHRVYVTLGVPLASPLYESVVDIACRNAVGATSASSAFGLIYSDFMDRDVRRKSLDGLNHTDAIQLRYWVNAGDPLLSTVSANCQTLTAMLNSDPTIGALNGVGTCLAWANLLLSCERVHGTSTGSVIEVESIERNDGNISLDGGLSTRGLLLVKNWSFAAVGTGPAECSPFLFLNSEVSDGAGAAGQGATTNPPGAFFNHFIVFRDGQYYDPSYGTAITSNQNAWESISLDGYRKACATGPTIVNKKETMSTETVFR